MAFYPSFNLIESIVDEVALEGLDGITLQALWIRLANRFHDPLPFPKFFMEQVWSICKKLKEFSFYELMTPREPFVIFDRYEHVHPDLGIILEPPNVPPDIYPHHPIKDSKTGIKGSCSSYYTRKNIKDIVKNASLDEITEKYGLSLVIVASQPVRTKALMDSSVSPTLELTIMHYCFLERVGRSRYHGEVTQGKLSLAALNEDPKSLFYHRKFLLHHKLITKQVHHQKSAGHCGNGSLLHLPRFYVERKPKVTYLAEQVLEILRSKKNGVAEYDEIRKKLGIKNSIRKLFKTSFFQKIVKTDLCVPYRTLYPNAEPSEWRPKQDPTKEKKIKVVQVIYPDVDIADLWNKEEKDEDEDIIELDVSDHKFKVPYLKQANAIVEASEFDGIAQVQLGKQMGLTKLQARSFLRNLVKIGIVATYMNDIGRQRITKYVSKRFEERSKMSKQFNKEMYKIKELTKGITNEKKESKANSEQKEKEADMKQEDDQKSHLNNDKNLTDVDTSDDTNKDTHKNCVRVKEAELKNKFYAVNSILRRYRLLKFRSKYKCTMSESLNMTLKTATKEEKLNVSSVSMQKITNNAKATSLYNSIKTNLITQKPVHTGSGVNEVFGFMEVVQNSEKKNACNITYRLLRRANMIIEAVKEHQVIDDMTKLMKMICEEEDKEGYEVKIDKKSLIRLLQKLAKDNLVKNIKLTLSANGREKNLIFICDPNIDTDHTVIKSAVEQAKLKFCLMVPQKPKMFAKRTGQEFSDKQDKADKSDSKEQLHDLSKSYTTVNFKYDSTVGKRYGLTPKFIKMKTMHVMLFYLVYDHVGVPKVSQEEQIKILRSNGYDIDDGLVQEFSTIYNTEVSWKMFIPPLPKHGGWSEGWSLMCDVLMSLPLSIFVKIYNIKYVIPDFDHYLSHPIRKHYLVKNLPSDIRDALLHARKYIFNIHNIVSKLGYIGLIQFGPQRLKEKDQVFIYVNRRTELMDTVSSAPSYHNIEDKEYPVTKYFFDNIQTVEKYWYDMWNICINTPLGGRLVVHGKDIVVEDLDKKNVLVQAIVARNPKEASTMDTGVVPGDRKGAAGIDSAFFAHLKRNWNWAANYSMYQTKTSRNSRKCEKSGQRDLHLSKIQTKPVKYTEYVGLKKVSGPPTPAISGTELKKQMYDYISKPTDIGRKNEVLLSHQSSRQNSVVRRVMPRKRSSHPRLKYDEDDYQAMKMMSKLRTDWEPHEINILLVCKVAMTYLSPNPRKQAVNFMAVRDVLRTYSYTSYNKTSRACQRRLMYMIRQQCTINSVALGVEEIKQDPFIDERYNGIMDRLKNECSSTVEYEKRVTQVFKELVDFIMKKYYDIADMKPNKHMAMPKTAHEFNLLFKMIYPTKPYYNQGFKKEVRNANDIHSATINSVIHSSMYCAKDKRSWAYQIFKIYQHYPEILLRQAMIKISRIDQMVTVRKNHLSTLKKGGNYVPMSSAQYKFSANYEYKLQTKWHHDIFKGTFDIFSNLLQYHMDQKVTVAEQESVVFNGIEIQPVSSGIVMVINDLLARNQIDFDIEMPEQVIVLDSRYQGKDETYFKVAQRYQDILTRLYRFKFGNAAAQNARSLELNETEVNEKLKNTATKKRSLDKSDDLEEPVSKIRRKDENCDERKQIKESSNNQQDEVITDKKSIDKNIRLEELTSKYNLNVPVSVEKDCAERSSKKRSIDAEEDSVNCEKPYLKRPKLYSDDSVDLLDAGELREINLYEDLKNVEKMKIVNKPLQIKVLAEEQSKKQASLNQSNSSTDLTAIPRRVNEIIKNMPLETNYLNSYCKIDDTGDIQKKYTRIAMLRMKKELDDLIETDSHHAHEYFVVNAFKMFYWLDWSSLEATSSLKDQIEYDKNDSIPDQLVPLKMKIINKVLNEVNQYAIFPKNVISYKDYKDNMMKKDITVNWNHIDAVYNFVREKKELGACPQELMDKFFHKQGTDLYTIVLLLIENRIFLRSGITSPRYVHHHHVDPWLIHSCKIHRLEQEAMGPFKDSIYATMLQEKIININVKTDAKHNDDTDKEIKTICATPSTSLIDNEEAEKKVEQDEEKVDDNLNNQENNEKKDNKTNEECDTFTRKRTPSQRTCSSSQKDKPMQLSNLPAEEIKIVVRPWIRIDGVLNRKVLDKMLGAVLGYSLLHPGLTMTKMQNRFIPALQPFHTRELVEILIKLGCVKSKLLKKTHVTLFSQSSTLKICDITLDASCLAAEDEIILEPAIDAVLKFGIFLSRTMYSANFI